MDLDALDTFAKIAEAGSLTAAAKLHGLPKSSLSLKLRQLESDLDMALFVREGRGLALTDAGIELLAHTQRILDACDGARSALAAMRDTVAGTLRIASTGEFGTAFNAQMLYAFRQLYPLVKLELVFISPTVLFAPDRLQSFDVIVSWDDPGDDGEGGERIASATFGLFASPAYLEAAGCPTHPDALQAHRGVLYRRGTGLQSWRLKRGTEIVELLPRCDFSSNDYWTVKYFAVAGEGIVYLPTFFADIECERGHLVPLMPEWQSEEKWIYIRIPQHNNASRKTRAFVDFCKDYFSPGYGFRGPRYYVETVLDAASDQEGTAT